MKRIIRKLFKSFALFICVALIIVFPLTASNCTDRPCFTDFTAEWNGDFGDIKMNLTTDESRLECGGTITIDGETIEVIGKFDHYDEMLILFDKSKVDTSSWKWSYYLEGRIFIAEVSGYKKSVTFKVIYDYTGRTGEKSLLRKEFVLTRTDLE